MLPFDYKSHDGAHGGFTKEEPLFTIDVEPEHIIREVWCYFWRGNSAGIEAWVQATAIGGETVRIPAMVYQTGSSYFGFATSQDSLGKVVASRGAIYWNNAAIGSAAPMNPFPLPPVRCRQVQLRTKFPAGALQAYFGVMSVPPL